MNSKCKNSILQYHVYLDNNQQINQAGTKRPNWCIFGKQNQNVETLLFKGKFYDWPNDFKEFKSVNDTGNNMNKMLLTERVCISLFKIFRYQ